MRIHEYQAKQMIAGYGVPIPRGRVASSSAEAVEICEELGLPLVIKAQVLAGGRGKAGGIRVVKSAQEVEEVATEILGMTIHGLPVRKLLVEEAVSIQQEIYVGITLDRRARGPLVLASASGGMDIEQIAARSPESIVREPIHPLLGLHDYQLRNLALAMNLPRELWRPFGQGVSGLWQAYRDADATLAEMNPFAITTDGRLLALDAKMTLDDNALMLHPQLAELRDADQEDALEREARKFGLSYIKMDGEIGCMVNGAGLAMMTMDLLQTAGGRAANFLDVGGGASAEKVGAALSILLRDPQVKVMLINIFGGITRCDEVARGILHALEEVEGSREVAAEAVGASADGQNGPVALAPPPGGGHLPPIVVRLVGTNAEEGRALLAQANMIACETLSEAAETAVRLVREGSHEHLG